MSVNSGTRSTGLSGNGNVCSGTLIFRTEKLIERKYNDSEYRMRLYEEKRGTSDWYEIYLENPMDPVLRRRYEMLFGRGSEIDEGTARTIDLFKAVNMINKMYDRGVGFWLRLMFSLGTLGFLLWISLSLLFWRPFP